jgi:hypothetical protein
MAWLIALALMPGCKFLADEFYYVDAPRPMAAAPEHSDSASRP